MVRFGKDDMRMIAMAPALDPSPMPADTIDRQTFATDKTHGHWPAKAQLAAIAD
jgi:hypothetical protein